MAKKRYNTRDTADVTMIEIIENGVIKKILVPLASIASKTKKKPVDNNVKIKSKTAVVIAPRNLSLESGASALTSRNFSDPLTVSNALPIGQSNQNLATCPSIAAPCTNVLGMPQTNCLSSSGSFMHPFQTFLISNAPVIINSNGSQPSGPTFPSSFPPMVLSSKTVNPGSASSYVLQPSSVRPLIQIPSQHSQIQLLSNHQTILSPVNSINQSQLYLNQQGIQNTVLLTPTTKPLVLNPTNQLYTHHVRPTLLENVTAKPVNSQLQGIVLNNSSHIQLLNTNPSNANKLHLSGKRRSNNQQDKGMTASKVKTILPKTSEQTVYEGLSPDKQNLIDKLALAAERSSNIGYSIPLNNNQLSLTPNSNHLSKVPLIVSSQEAVTQVRDVNSTQRCSKNILQVRVIENSAGNKLTKLQENKEREKKLKMQIGVNVTKNNSKLDLDVIRSKSKKSRLVMARKHILGKSIQVPTVVLNPISIAPGVTTRVENVKVLELLKERKFKSISKFRIIRPKPSMADLACSSDALKEARSCSPEMNDNSSKEVESRKCSKSGDELDSDYTIAQMLDTDDSWSGDEELKERSEPESKKRKSTKSNDKSYRCYLGRTVESPKYPRTRSFFRSKRFL